MAENTGNYKRIAKNTIMLYFRMLLIMFVSLYTVRALLSALGQEDYGLYNVIGGIVVMFSFLSNVLSSASQRYFAYEIGKEDYHNLSKTYSVMIIMYVIFTIIIIILAETIGLWFLHNKMTIPSNRFFAAQFVYQFSIFSFCWKILTSPHQAIIIANEKMGVYAYVGIAEVFLQLILVVILSTIPGDSLIVYSVLMFAIVFIINSCYVIYSRKKYKKIKFVREWDKQLLSNIVSYSSWTLLGTLAAVARGQGINIVLNVYFTPIVNASRGIAHNVESAVTSFANSFYTAVRPQIIKYYAQRDLESCYKLVFRSSKYSYYLLMLFIIPIVSYTPDILNIWLNDYPEYSVVFVRLILLSTLIDSLANPLITFNQATGNVKMYQIVVGILVLCNIPFSILAFELGASPTAAFIVSIVIAFLAMLARLVVLYKQHRFPVKRYMTEVIFPIATVSVVCSISSMALKFSIGHGSSFTLVIGILSIMTMSIIVSIVLGTDKSEKVSVVQFVKSKIK